MSLFLIESELVELTALRRIDAQRRWLDKHGWAYQVDHRGRPKISRMFFERKMMGLSNDEIVIKPKPIYEINVSALPRRA